MSTATFAFDAYHTDYRGEDYWRFSVARPVQAATSGRALVGGEPQRRSCSNR